MELRMRSKSTSLGDRFRDRVAETKADLLRRETSSAGLLERHLGSDRQENWSKENRRPVSALRHRDTAPQQDVKPSAPCSPSRRPRHTVAGVLGARDLNLQERSSKDEPGNVKEPSRKRSKMSEHLETMRSAENPVVALEATLAPLVDDVLAAMHMAEKRARVSAAGLEQHVNLEHRRKVVAWLVKAFHVVSFDDQILYGTVQLADLYLHSNKKYVSGSVLQSVVMACVCTMLKLATADHRVYSVPDLIAHITHNQITLERVLRVERDVLVGVDFNLSAPTMHQFLESFTIRITPDKCGRMPAALGGCTKDWVGSVVVPAPEAVVGGPSIARTKCFHLADCLCQLSLLHHELLDFLPSLVAAAALVLSVWTLRGPPAVKAALLEDIGSMWDVHGEELKACVLALHEEWVCPSDRDASLSVLEKFATPERQEVSDIPAPLTAPRFP